MVETRPKVHKLALVQKRKKKKQVMASTIGFLVKKKPHSASDEKKDCLYCKKPWSPGHKCKEYFEQKKNMSILSVKTNSDQQPTNERAHNQKNEYSPSAKDDENDLENGIKDIMMDDIDYDYKSH
jgi:hypothetical protein